MMGKVNWCLKGIGLENIFKILFMRKLNLKKLFFNTFFEFFIKIVSELF